MRYYGNPVNEWKIYMNKNMFIILRSWKKYSVSIIFLSSSDGFCIKNIYV